MSAAPALLSSKDVTFIKSNGGRGLTPARAMSSDISSSSDEFHIKVRKPYTITKQREKWTEHEHQKFLEALKLYGRSWRHIKEHIGTKTAVQIRSHAQKFFFKVEREASNNGLTGQVQEIEIPPPRPKRKPSRPYPRKAGSSLPLSEEHGDTFTNCCSAVNPASFSSSTDNEGLALKANTQHENAPGSYEVRLAENTKPLDEVSDKVVLHDDCQQQAGIPPDNNAIPCTERNFLVQPQMGAHNDGEGSAMEASNSADEMSMILPASCEAKVSMCEAKGHPESQSGYILPNKGEGGVCTPLNLFLETSPCAEVRTSRQSSYHEGSNSNPAGMWMDSLINYYGRLPLSRDPQTPSHGPTHELHPAFPTSPWQFMQASLMNHSAAFAAAMAAAVWAMGGTGSASPYTCQGYYGVQPSPNDINAAAFAAASASWWAMSGFVPDPLGHQRHHPRTGATPSHVHMPRATGNTPQHEMSANPTPVEDEVPVFSIIPAQGYKANKKILSGPNMSTETLASDICVQGSNGSSNIRKNPSTLADELDGGDWRTQEGSSSAPPLTAHSGEQDTPSPSDNDNENLSLCICVDETHNGPLCEGKCVRMKFKNMERGRHHQKELRYGENESGKRFKGSIHDMDSRKEVSLQGRKAFEALFTCRTLPQTFRKAIGKDEAQQEKAKWLIVSVPVTDSNSCHLEGIALHETDGNIECAMITEDDETNTNCFKEFSTKSDVDMYGPCTSLNSKSRDSTSGFTPYKKPSAERRALSYSAVRGYLDTQAHTYDKWCIGFSSTTLKQGAFKWS